MSDQPGQQLSEEELRAIEAEIDRINVDDVILQTVVSLINLGARKGAVGAPPEAGVQPDYEQLHRAIEAARALLTVVEPRHGDKLGPIRDALAQLQMAYAQGTGGGAPQAPGGGEGGQRPPEPPPGSSRPEPQGGQGGAPGQRSGRLWIPGQ